MGRKENNQKRKEENQTGKDNGYIKCNDYVFLKVPEIELRKKHKLFFAGRVKEGQVAVVNGLLSGKFRTAKAPGLSWYRLGDEVTYYSTKGEQAELKLKQLETADGTEFDIKLTIHFKIDYNENSDNVEGLLNFHVRNTAPTIQFANKLYAHVRSHFSRATEDEIRQVQAGLNNVVSLETWYQILDEAKELGLDIKDIKILPIEFAPEIEVAYRKRKTSALDDETKIRRSQADLEIALKQAQGEEAKLKIISDFYKELSENGDAVAAQNIIIAKFGVDAAKFLSEGNATTVFSGVQGLNGSQQPVLFNVNGNNQNSSRSDVLTNNARSGNPNLSSYGNYEDYLNKYSSNTNESNKQELSFYNNYEEYLNSFPDDDQPSERNRRSGRRG